MDMRQVIKGKEFKEVLLKILVRFDEFCKIHDISYSIAYGTALGAIRHKGFIPWDDDVAVIMLRSEYNKFEKAWKEHILHNKEHYTLWGEMDEVNYFMCFCAKFFDSNTVLYEHLSKRKFVEYGIFIDIFVLDHIPIEKSVQIKFFKNIKSYSKLIYHFQQHCQKWNNFVDKYKLSLPCLKTMSNRLIDYKTQYNDAKTPQVSFTQDYKKGDSYNRSIHPYEWFTDIILVDFEGYKLPIVKSYNQMLREYYGDYMELPPEDKRSGHNLEAYWKHK